MIGHVGTKVSALIDGQLSEAESERLWGHVHGCPLCRAHVEREGWVKTRLADLGMRPQQPAAPNYLHSVLCATTNVPPVSGSGAPAEESRRRPLTVAVLGAGSVGAAMVGVLALAVPATAPPADRRTPATSLTRNANPLLPTSSSGPQAPTGGSATTAPAGAVASVGSAVNDTTDPGWVRIKR